MFVVDQLSLLGLNQREIKVFTLLATFGPLTVTKTAGRTGLPRTTVDAIVRRLEVSGLTSRIQVGKHWEWRVNLEEVTKKLSLLTTKLSPLSPSEQTVPSRTVVSPETLISFGGNQASLVIFFGKPALGQAGVFTSLFPQVTRIYVPLLGDCELLQVTTKGLYYRLAEREEIFQVEDEMVKMVILNLLKTWTL